MSTSIEEQNPPERIWIQSIWFSFWEEPFRARPVVITDRLSVDSTGYVRVDDYDSLLAQRDALVKWLEKIRDAERTCSCECNTEYCCAIVGEFCAQCWGRAALALVNQDTDARKV